MLIEVLAGTHGWYTWYSSVIIVSSSSTSLSSRQNPSCDVFRSCL